MHYQSSTMSITTLTTRRRRRHRPWYIFYIKPYPNRREPRTTKAQLRPFIPSRHSLKQTACSRSKSAGKSAFDTTRSTNAPRQGIATKRDRRGSATTGTVRISVISSQLQKAKSPIFTSPLNASPSFLSTHAILLCQPQKPSARHPFSNIRNRKQVTDADCSVHQTIVWYLKCQFHPHQKLSTPRSSSSSSSKMLQSPAFETMTPVISQM